MSSTVLTLIDLAKRTGSDATVGLVEEVLTVAPELRTIPVVPKAGTSYKLTRRTGLGSGGFRNANEGIAAVKSTFEQVEVPMYFFDGQMVVDEAIVKADDRRLGDILADEGGGILQGSYIALGDQVYRGVTANAKGFAGLKAQVDATLVVDATGTGANATETAWAVFESPRGGLHLPIGNNGLLSLGSWVKQQVVDGSAQPYMGYVNNLSFYIGLAFGSKYSAGCVKNITSAAGKGLTDSLGAQLYAKFPIDRKPTRWFMSRNSLLYLQQSRSAIGQYPADRGGKGAWPDEPTTLAGVPITVTDSITAITNW